MKKNKLSIIMNLILVLLEVLGLIMTIKIYNKIPLEYYTELTNLYTLIITSIYLYYLITNKKIPKLIQILKYISVLDLTITFLMVVFVLVPMNDFNFKWLVFNEDFIFFHFLCPIVSFISYMFIDKYDKFTKKDIIRSTYPTIIYSIVLITLNILNIVTGPYPFLEVRNNPVIHSLIWLVSLQTFLIGLTILLTYLKNKNSKLV